LESEVHSREQIELREEIMETLVEKLGELSQDQYGNYVAQHVLKYSTTQIHSRAIDILLSAPIDFACHKYASNVLEHALSTSDKEEITMIVKAIMDFPVNRDGSDVLSTLTTNRFGNYVVQKMLEVGQFVLPISGERVVV